MYWKEWSLSELLSKPVQNGYSPICASEPNGRWILGLGALTNSGLDISQVKPAPIGDEKVKDYILENGDFLVSRSNTRDKVGRSAMFKGEIRNCSYPDLMMRFSVDEEKIEPRFLEQYLRSSNPVRHFQNCASGTSGTMMKINKGVLEDLVVPLPPLPEQRAIADLLSTWDAAIDKTERLIALEQKRYSWLLIDRINKIASKNKWVRSELGKVAEVVEKVPLSSVDDEILLTVKLHCLGIEKNERAKPRFTENGRPYYKRNAGEFLIGRQNFHNGGFGILPNELDGLIASNAISSVLFHEQILLKEFAWYQMSNPNYFRKVGDFMDGTGQKELLEKQILKSWLWYKTLHLLSDVRKCHFTYFSRDSFKFGIHA